MRLWVRTRSGFRVALTRIFKVREDAADTAASAVLYVALLPISARGNSRGCAHSNRKENSSGSSRRRLRGMSSRLDELRGPDWNGSDTGFRNRNRIPFRPMRVVTHGVRFRRAHQLRISPRA